MMSEWYILEHLQSKQPLPDNSYYEDLPPDSHLEQSNGNNSSVEGNLKREKVMNEVLTFFNQ